MWMGAVLVCLALLVMDLVHRNLDLAATAFLGLLLSLIGLRTELWLQATEASDRIHREVDRRLRPGVPPTPTRRPSKDD